MNLKSEITQILLFLVPYLTIVEAKYGSDCKNNSTACDSTFEACRIFKNPIPNQPKVHECTCKEGAVKNSESGNCEDKNECTLNQHTCNPHSQYCINQPLGYTCECLPGHYKSGNNCADKNECNYKNICGVGQITKSFCENYVGGYSCTCGAGWRKIGTIDVENRDGEKCELGEEIVEERVLVTEKMEVAVSEVEVEQSSGSESLIYFLIVGGILLVILIGVVGAIGYKKKWYQGGVEV